MSVLQKINTLPKQVTFTETIAYIDENYHFTPISFKNGMCFNEENQNNGSCKIFYFAQLNKLSEEQTLHLLGVITEKMSSGIQTVQTIKILEIL